MKFLILMVISMSLCSCSMIKSKTDRCFDLFEEHGKVNMHVYEKGKRVFSCTELETL